MAATASGAGGPAQASGPLGPRVRHGAHPRRAKERRRGQQLAAALGRPRVRPLLFRSAGSRARACAHALRRRAAALASRRTGRVHNRARPRPPLPAPPWRRAQARARPPLPAPPRRRSIPQQPLPAPPRRDCPPPPPLRQTWRSCPRRVRPSRASCHPVRRRRRRRARTLTAAAAAAARRRGHRARRALRQGRCGAREALQRAAQPPEQRRTRPLAPCGRLGRLGRRRRARLGRRRRRAP